MSCGHRVDCLHYFDGKRGTRKLVLVCGRLLLQYDPQGENLLRTRKRDPNFNPVSLALTEPGRKRASITAQEAGAPYLHCHVGSQSAGGLKLKWRPLLAIKLLANFRPCNRPRQMRDVLPSWSGFADARFRRFPRYSLLFHGLMKIVERR